MRFVGGGGLSLSNNSSTYYYGGSNGERSEGRGGEVVVAVYTSGYWRQCYCWQCKRGDMIVVVGECWGGG